MAAFSIRGDGSRPEGTGGTTPFTFSVTRSGDTAGLSLVDYWMWPEGYAAEPNVHDFTGPTAGTLYFQAGETAKTITINVAADSTVEANEAFNVSLSNPRGATIDANSAQAVILNDDGGPPPPSQTTLAFAGDVTRAEGNAGSTAFVFTVNRGGPTDGTSGVGWAVQGLGGPSVADGADFPGGTLPYGSLAFAPGETSKTITVNVAGDTTVEPTETFRIVMHDANGASIPAAGADAFGTITNDDGGGAGPTSVSIGDLAPKSEGTGGLTTFVLDLTRTGDLSGGSMVDYWLWPMSDGGPAEADQFDFDGPTTGTITFAAGEASRQLLVNVRGDSALEQDEAFNVGLSNPRGTVIGDGATRTTILNDDGGSTTTLSWGNPGGVHKNEGSQTSNNPATDFVYVLNRTGDVSGATTADWTVIRGSVDENDFTALPFGQVGFAAGEVSKQIVLRVNGDLAVEPDEAFRLVMSNVVGAVGPPENSGTIINDDGGTSGPTTVSIAGSIERAEGNSGATPWEYLVTRSGDLSGSTLVDYFTIGDVTGPHESATPDYRNGTGTLTFQAGETQKTIRMEIVGDTTPEPNESFTLGLSNARGASITGGSASGRILDDDGWVMA